MLAALTAAALSFPSLVAAQVPDTLVVGDRVRVRIGEARGYTNVFIGRVAALSHDTLTLEIPRDKGTMIFARTAIAEVAVANGRESRWVNAGSVAPMFALPIVFAATPVIPGPHSNGDRNRHLLLAAALLATPIAAILRHPPAERWEPVYLWLDAK
jgi:hypothetical protein